MTMSPQDASKVLDGLHPSLRAAAKNVLFHAFGAQGMPWGTPLADLEALSRQVALALQREILHAALQRQADSPLPDSLTSCPSCSGPVRLGDPQPHDLNTDAGPISWQEPTAYCPR